MPLSVATSIRTAAQLTAFLGRDMVGALGGLEQKRVLGLWPGREPNESREARSFRPDLYGEDHAHAHHEICLLTEGSCLFSLNRRGAILRAGDLVFCPAGAVHAEAHRRSGQTYRLVWWSLEAKDPTLHVTHYGKTQGYALEFGTSLKPLPADAQRALDRLRESAEAPNCPDLETVREALLTLTLALMRRAMAGDLAPWDRRAELVERATEFVRAHSGEALNLATVATAMKVSPNYLTSLFREVAGISLGRFILEERMGRAQRLLRADQATVKAVALALGFSDPYAFSRAFKRHTGLAPSQWQIRERRKK
jgi:AraC-like DNA-binding protein